MTGQSLVIWFIVGAVALGALLILVKLIRHRQRSWVERDLQRGDLGFLRDFAFFRNRCPPSAVVDRLRERGFLAKTERGRSRVTLNGWIAILLRRTFVRRGRTQIWPRSR